MLSFTIFLLAVSSPASVAALSSTSSSTSSSTVTYSPDVISVLHAPSPSCTGAILCPGEVTDAYNVTALHNAGVTGSGQTVVIDDACGSSTIASDLMTFDSYFGLPNPTLNIIKPNHGALCSNSGWALETSLDVEYSHAMAPGATIDLLEASQPDRDLFSAWTYALKNSLGNQISNSWGGGEACQPFVEDIINMATAAHVTILASAGDDGAWGINTNAKPAIPADCKQVLAVGGTQLNMNSTDNGYGSESAWSGTGGGYVPKTMEPAYQTFAGITDTYGVLAKNDVSAVASCNSPVWVYIGGWQAVCGTSVACPIWAGFMADVNQIRASDGFSGAGFIQPFLYKTVYGSGGTSTLYPVDFHDVTTGNNGWPAGTGWDVPTGLGSMNGYSLALTLGNTKSL